MRHATTATLTLVAALAVGTLAGCSSDDSSSSSDTTTTAATDDVTRDAFPDGVTLGLPSGVEAPAEASAGAGWGSDGSTVWVVTFGSSTNPSYATIDSAESGTLNIALALVDPDGPGTMDFVPTTTVLDLPAEIDTSAPVQVVLGELGSVEIESADVPGWITASGE